jgi:transglutaminase/protease-like cytokinesis protein 3
MKRNFTKVFLSLFSIFAIIITCGAMMFVDAIKNNSISAYKIEIEETPSQEDISDSLVPVPTGDFTDLGIENASMEHEKNDTSVSTAENAEATGDLNGDTETNEVDNKVETPDVANDNNISSDTELSIDDVVDDNSNLENEETDNFIAETKPEEKIEVSEPVTEETVEYKPLALVGGYASIDRSAYSEAENELLDTILAEIHHGLENPELKEKEISLNSTFDIESYYRVATYFYVYYGQKRAVDETFDLVNAGREGGYLRLRYDDIRVFEAERQANQAKIDNILSGFNAGSEEYVLKQISEYLRKSIVYTHGYYDLTDAINGKTVCNGYALLFNAMANRAGIKSDMCIGKSSNGEYHAWNRVTLSDGSYRFYDITFYDSNGGNAKYLHSKTSFHGSYLINDYTSCWFDN